MKKTANEIINIIKNGEYTAREAAMAGICLFLLGLVIGIFASPKKYTMIASHNGNRGGGACTPEGADEVN